VALGVALDHLLQLQPVHVGGGHRHADQAAALVHGEGDQLRGGQLGGEDDVALVLPVLVVDDDDRTAGGDLGDGQLDPVQPQVLPHLAGLGCGLLIGLGSALGGQDVGEGFGRFGDGTHTVTPFGAATRGCDCCGVRVRSHQERIPATTRTK
jgi:hypothetical protein